MGGLGSSHTAPRGTAVPARPPTHRDYSLKVDCGPSNGPMAPPNGYAGLSTFAPFLRPFGVPYL